MIKINNVTKRFGDLVVLKDLDLHIKEGEFVVLLGASGCGKSTLLNLIAGFEQPSEGTVMVNDRLITDVDPGSGMVFQQYALFPWQTVMQNVAFGLKLKGVPKAAREERAQHYINMVGLAGFENSYPKELSGGMRQRVAIARVLANDTDVILLDEPFAALDAMTRQVLQEQLVKIYEANHKTIVFITHSIDEALLLSTRMIVLGAKPGRIVKDIENDLPHPRNAKVQLSQRYNDIKTEVWDVVQEEVMKGLESKN
ncbi:MULTISPECIES: ABC transporter ATP-binding protein [Oligella]|uniref:ATP-binding protein n=1 Tax=Oligella urethralis DNF00040 TaxID=1401065 RepID=A0A095Z8E2_9BURK|nr:MULTISPECIES: ABC transporter ATP-binding protein [Oligella]AVL71557.1 ABC transporter ATP-binding protein [Oligella urethralis]KGF30621.1 ATP-binding protein [Oligella urethralis DNF00040]MDK6203192.1 ABC transporter ATP-binding protein [Oligella urethralis]OFS88379.1 ATP-binding protein [Oligella sp. HMSC05A10]WOS38228.1 Bicarbonate transport ATP-binding protein CmpC [Oligella urethralis]